MDMELLERDPGSAVLNRSFDMPGSILHIDVDAYFAELAQKHAQPAVAPESTPEPREDVTNKPVSIHRIDVDAYFAELAQKHAQPDVTPKSNPEPRFNNEKVERKGNRLRAKIVGGVALTAVLVLSGLPESIMNRVQGKARPVAEVEHDAKTILADQQAITETTSTTKVPAPEQYLPQPGEVFGTLTIPAICEEILVKEYSQQEEIDFINKNKGKDQVIGAEDMTFADLIKDNTPNDGCPNVDAYEQQVESSGVNFVRRTERYRSSAVSEDNPDGKVTYWQPVAGHGQSIDGEDLYLSALPWMEEGNVALGLHGSTFSAAGADLEVLVPGHVAQLEFDGKVYEYQFVEKEIIPVDLKDDYAQILNYSHPASARTLTIFNCNSLDGNTGSSDARGVYRFVFIRVV